MLNRNTVGQTISKIMVWPFLIIKLATIYVWYHFVRRSDYFWGAFVRLYVSDR